MKNIKIALVVTLAFGALFISFYNFFYLRNLENRLRGIENNLTGKSLEAIDNVAPVENPVALETFVGTLKKEPIPKELDLGDYWYIIYFDEPYFLELNARGVPMDVNRLEVYPPEREEQGMDAFDGQHVEIKGSLTWGYAESRVIQAEEMVLK
ncbi:MAG: hypothetical protein ACD_24C00158G0002 [uncultured bacterium]|uniref:Uncharacterized protein n=1 Tax=candidate division WWE3 bacterium TaxID=2053526 RepID=A0A656PP66_UNCKA|nr:hypothetical protein P147_WWE3C00001G0296 [candidate division WWE3 bacterium RAAC2_WWE3_1]EKD96168.1 MAG: hypothetical protein ACD_24C00158G0002 [uncultured bacterium]KKS29649.1 MAG: hypothetical protein UU91_C0004G0041 [candidate division WWE3 bacterium GW2011_GWB1_42_117]KKS55459.1 MAG: hypothetical protein UV21_C0001G0041 [candidate division WWE3 bacterium GW2011_GWD2_42_34]KKT05944.1 MAG: hypothetical protein UV83_C0001G0262 [candidate division WWE3 bacterium GW2011_GWE2_43_18]KKT07167.